MLMPMARAAAAMALTVFCAMPVHAQEVRVMTSGGMAAPYVDLITAIERATAQKIVTVVTTTGIGEESIPNRLRRGEAADVVMLPDAALSELIKGGLIVSNSRVPLARSGIGMAVRAGAPKPDISSVDGLRRALLQAKSIAYSAQVSGLYLSNELFPRLGIADQLKSKSIRVERERVGAVVARGEAEIGFQQVSELLPIGGVDYVGPLPAEVQRMTLFSAGVASHAKNPEGARALIAFLQTPAAEQMLRRYHLEPVVATVASHQPEIATAIAFTEGPTVDREGNVYFTELVWQRILRLSPTGILSTFREQSNNANGLLIDREGRLIACEGADAPRRGTIARFRPQVTRTDLQTGAIEILADSFEGRPFIGPNDVTMDGRGRLYVTDLTGAAVYRIDGPQQVSRILAAPDIQRPNGIQISPDDRTLYVIEANGAPGGARLIRAYDLAANGTVSNMRVHYNFSPGRSGDGMSIDTDGNLYVSAGMNQLRGTAETLDTTTGVYVISPQGKLLKLIPIMEDYITNNAFGGPDMKTLYVTAGKTVYKVRTDIAGLPR
jgi:sugar lactone lactonase YvrE